MYVIMMNGPPRSGKDSVAERLAAQIEDRHCVQPLVGAMITPLRRIIYDMIGETYSATAYEAMKDVSHDLLDGRTIRQAIIDMAEQHIRPSYGRDFWARRFDRVEMSQWDDTVTIITDLGFDEEREYFVQRYGYGNVLPVHVYRDGTEWANDSRRYVQDRLGYVSALKIGNNTTQRWAARAILAHCESALGWTF